MSSSTGGSEQATSCLSDVAKQQCDMLTPRERVRLVHIMLLEFNLKVEDEEAAHSLMDPRADAASGSRIGTLVYQYRASCIQPRARVALHWSNVSDLLICNVIRLDSDPVRLINSEVFPPSVTTRDMMLRLFTVMHEDCFVVRLGATVLIASNPRTPPVRLTAQISPDKKGWTFQHRDEIFTIRPAPC